MNFLRFIFISVFCLTAFSSASGASDLAPDAKWLKKELTKMDLPKSFVTQALKAYDPSSFETVLRLNLLGFLQPPQHMDLVTEKAVRQCNVFQDENGEAFQKAQKKFKVSPSVISALLWVETKHGEDRGQFHVLSVYLDLLQVDLKKNKKILTIMAFEKNLDVQKYPSAKELKKVMAERTKAKAAWAREQILALAKIAKKKQLDLDTLQGSFAGAFGLPQFIPTSYLDFAKSMKAQVPADLSRSEDAIMSVANYLKKHGWKESRTSSKVKSLMRYNNSQDYADSILEIARQAQDLRKADKSRSLSSEK